MIFRDGDRVKSVNMSGFGYSMFSEKVKLHVGGKTITVGKSNTKQNQGMFGVSQSRQSQNGNNNSKKLSAIMTKFNAGKKLTAEELAYLRQNSPENYMKVQQVMMEREMLERQMEQAKTKEQTNAVYMTAVSASMPKGTGGEGGGASMDVAKLNHFADAHRIYTASSHYKAKIDQSDIAEEERLKNEEIAGKLEEQQAKLEESMEKQELLMEELSVMQEKQASEKEENKQEEEKDVLGEVERLKKASRRKRKKVHARRNKNSKGSSGTFHFNPLSEAEMYEKLRELYRTKNEAGTFENSNAKGNKATVETGFGAGNHTNSVATDTTGTTSVAGSLSTGVSVSTASVGSTIDISL